MTIEISIPAGLQYYFSKTDRDQIDYIENVKTIPPELEWNEIGEYFRAKFALSILKMDFYNYMKDALDLTWGSAFKTRGNQCTPCRAEDYTLKNCKPAKWLSPDIVWDENAIYSMWKCQDYIFVAGVMLTDDSDVFLLYSLLDRDRTTVLTGELDLPTGYWQVKDDIPANGYRCTNVFGQRIAARNIMILDDLHIAANEAVVSLMASKMLNQ